MSPADSADRPGRLRVTYSAELEQLQLERLQATLNRVYAHVPFYRKAFDAIIQALSGVMLTSGE